LRLVRASRNGLAWAHLAKIFNLPITTHSASFQNMHSAAGVDNGWRVEFHYAIWKTSEAIWKNHHRPDEELIRVANRPGLGTDPNEGALSEYLVE